MEIPFSGKLDLYIETHPDPPQNLCPAVRYGILAEANPGVVWQHSVGGHTLESLLWFSSHGWPDGVPGAELWQPLIAGVGLATTSHPLYSNITWMWNYGC